MTYNILIVDDAKASRDMAARIITSLGYTATVADNADMALTLVKQGGHFDLLFTDLIMPDLHGIDLARHVRSHDPSILVLFTSGDVMGEWECQQVDAGYIAKPYRKVEIAEVLRDMLK